MKILVKSLAVVVMMFATGYNMANVKDDSGERPVFRQKGEKVFLNLLNSDSSEVRIKVIDEKGRVVFFEEVKDAFVVTKAINFEKAYSGAYKVIVTDNDETFKTDVVVR